MNLPTLILTVTGAAVTEVGIYSTPSRQKTCVFQIAIGAQFTSLTGVYTVRHTCITMKKATVRDLRNHFSRVSGWIENGEAVEITKGGKAFARLVPATEGKARKLVKVDFAKQLRKTWGNRVLSAAEVAAMRAAELEGEQG